MNPPITTSRGLVPTTARNLQLAIDQAATALPTAKISSALAGGQVHQLEEDPELRQQVLLPNDETYLNDGSAVKSLPISVPLPRHGRRGTHMGRGDISHASFSSDDLALNAQIVATHSADFHAADINVRPVLAITEDVLRLVKPLTTETITPSILRTTESQTHDNKKNYFTSDHDSEIVRELAFPINKISTEIICKASAGGEAHSVAMDLLRSLSNYPWDVKAMITLAAFAINYGEFWLVEHLRTTNPLAKNISTLRGVFEIMEHAGEAATRRFDQVLQLLREVVKVIHCIIQFKELPSSSTTRIQTPEMMAAATHIPTAIYWIIRSILASSSILLNLIGGDHEYISSTSESWEISSLAHKLSIILEFLLEKLDVCKNHINRVQEEEAYRHFVILMKTSHIDNLTLLRAMIRPNEDQKPLYDGSKRTKERLEVLKLKYVLLLISDLDLPQEELNVLHLIYEQNTNRHEYEVLWLPIVDQALSSMSVEERDRKFYQLRDGMPWYSVDHYTLIERVANRYIRDPNHWNFVHMPMLVVLDPQGRASNLDALPMMWIWGSRAFNFTRTREESLWEDTIWNIELLAEPIDERIPEWIRDNKVICLYGGEDIDWIRKFSSASRSMANALHIPLEMLYVGKRNPRDKVRQCHETIEAERLSHTFPLQGWYDYTWYFWVRLWSMWNSRKHIGRNVDNDKIMNEILDLLTFDSSEPGWAIFCRGNYEMTKANGDILLHVLKNYETWGRKVEQPNMFVPVLDEEIHRTHPEHHCHRLILPQEVGYVPERVVCSECGKTMDKFLMYLCCTN